MKKISLVLGACALLAACSPTRPDAVDNPDVLASNASSSLDLTRVEMTDTSTVLRFNVNFRPGWWIRINENSYIIADGDTLPLVSAEGIVPGTEHTMPESGEDSFSLTFGPISPRARSLTFSEPGGGWNMIGVDLTGKRTAGADVPSSILRAADAPVMADAIMEVDSTDITLHIMDYVPELGTKVMVKIYGLGGLSFDETVDLNAKGSTQFKAPVYGTSLMSVNIASLGIYTPTATIAPEKAVNIYIDPRYSTIPSLKRLGENVPAQFVFTDGVYSPLDKAKAHCPVEPSIDVSGSIRPTAWKWISAQFADSIMAERKAIAEAIAQIESDASFHKYLMAELDASTINAFANASTIFGRSFYSAHPDFTGHRFMDSIHGMPSAEQFAALAREINIGAPELLAIPSYAFGVTKIDWSKYGVENQQVAEVSAYIQAYDKASEQGSVPDAMEETLRSFPNPFYAEAAEARAKVIEAKLKDLSNIKNETPQVPDDKVFDAIIAPHKGKVVLVDLWNTWCGPCRRALAANEPLKDGELSSPDIVWIYIADTSSETGSYSTMVPEIRGEHYMVNASQIKAIRDRFNVDGIPFYILVDREGNAEGHPDFRNHSALIEGIKSKL